MKTTLRSLQRLALSFAVLLLPLFLLSCASSPVALSAVGPRLPRGQSTGGSGYLIVYSGTEAVRLDKGIPYYVHTSYLIKTPDGRTFKWVPNHVGNMDESPQMELLPSGHYQVVAESEDYGRVYVPIVIEPGNKTEVHLEGKGSWVPQKPPLSDADPVRFPNGEMIGWRALDGKSSTSFRDN